MFGQFKGAWEFSVGAKTEEEYLIGLKVHSRALQWQKSTVARDTMGDTRQKRSL